MKGLQWSLLAGIVITCVIIGVAIILLLPVAGIDIKKYFGLEPVLGVPAEITYTTFPTPVSAEDTPESERIITAAGDPYQPSEIGCKIAEYIYNDYSDKGETGLRADCFIWDGGRENCIVGAGTFTLTDAIADPGTWEGTLSARDCHYCGLNTAWGDNPVFDEVCINYNLRDRKVGGSDFCNGQFSITGGTGEIVQFGNAECMGGTEGGCINTADWCDNCDGWWCDGLLECCGACPIPCGYPGAPCSWNNDGTDDFCDNDKDTIIWTADTSDGDPTYRVKDNHADDDSNARQIDIDPHKYLYGVIWDHGEKEYNVLFVRVPQPVGTSNFDWIKDDLKNWKRLNRLGNAFQYARMVRDATVTTASKNEITLRQEIAAELGIDVSKVVYQECSSKDECLSSGDSEGRPLKSDSASEECDEEYNPITWKFQIESVKFRTNMPQNGVFQAGNTYSVRVTNWYNKYDKQEGMSWTGCYSLVDRQVSIYCTDCCDNNGQCNNPIPPGGKEDSDNCPADCT